MSTSGLRLLIGTLALVGTTGCAPVDGGNISTDFTVGPQGGTVTFAGGAVVLTVPAGAVPQSTQFTVTSTTDYPAQSTLVPGTAYLVGPSGFNFAQPVSLKVRYSGTPLPAGVRKAELGLYKVVSGAWQLTPGQSIDSAAGTLTASISSLSVFGILGAPAASLVITPPSLSIPVGGHAPLSAAVKDAAAHSLPDRPVTWNALDPSVATVGATGTVVGEQAGTGRVVATSDKVADTLVATVSNGVSGLLPACDPYTAPAVPAATRTFYIDAATGNDAANGLTAQTAWKTIEKANQSAVAGDRFLLNGAFTNEWIRPNNSGTASQKIVFMRAPGGSASMTVGKYDVGVDLTNLSHIVIDGLELTNISYPVQFFESHEDWVRNLYVHDAGSSNIRSHSTLNRVEDSRFERIGSEAANAGDAVYLSNGANNNFVLRNHFDRAGHGAIWISHQSVSDVTSDDNIIAHNQVINPWANGIGLNLTANRTISECNIVAMTADGTGANYRRFGTEIEGTDNIVRNNIIFTTGDGGISLEAWTFVGKAANATGNHIYNNTVWSTGGAGLRMVQKDVSHLQNNLIENNIFWANAGALDAGTRYSILADEFNSTPGNEWPNGTVGGNIVRNNIFENNLTFMVITRSSGAGGNVVYSLTQAQAGLTGWANNARQDPLFTNSAQGNFTLTAGSPAVDAGVIISGRSYIGAAPDLGAIESH